MSEAVNETEVIAAPEGAKRKLDPGFSRNLKIIGGTLGAMTLLLVLVFVMRSGSNDQQARPSEFQVGSGNTQAAGDITPAMETMLREQQQIEAAAAAKKGETYIPPDTVGRTEVVDPVVAAQIGQSTYQATSLVQEGPASERDQRRREGLERQLAGYLAQSQGADSARVRVVADQDAGAAAAGPAATASAAASPAAARGAQLLPGLEIAAATLAGDLNVPAGASVFASAVVRSGPLDGAFMVGAARVVDESLEITFTQMRFGGDVYAIDAIVLDQATTANAIAGSVDRRILQRYVLPIALATAQGFFTAKSAVGSVTVNVGNDAGVATPAPSSEQARAAGMAKGFEIAGQGVQKAASMPIVVSAPRGTSVGLLFRAPVIKGEKQ